MNNCNYHDLIFAPTVSYLPSSQSEYSFKWFFFSHKLIFSFNPESVNITYKIENIEGPAYVQRWAFLLDLQHQQPKEHLCKSLGQQGGDLPLWHLWRVACNQFLDDTACWWNRQRGFSPHGALVAWVHSGARFAIVGSCKLSGVGERTHHPDWARTVYAGKGTLYHLPGNSQSEILWSGKILGEKVQIYGHQ